MFRSIRIGKYNPIEWFSYWFWNASGKDIFFAFTISCPVIMALTVPNFAFIVWSNPLINFVFIGELLYLEYWRDRKRKPTEIERLQKENVRLNKTVKMQRLLLDQKLSTIEKLMYEREIQRCNSHIK